MKKEPEKIGNLILDSIAQMGLTSRLEKQSAIIDWPKIVGDVVAAESEAVRIDGDILVVKVHRAAGDNSWFFLNRKYCQSWMKK